MKCLKQGLVSCKGHIYVCVIIMNSRWPWILFAISLHELSVFKFSLENFLFSSWREKKLSTLYIWTTKWFYFRNSPYYAVLVKSFLAVLFHLGSSDPIKDWLASEHMFFLLVFPLVGKINGSWPSVGLWVAPCNLLKKLFSTEESCALSPLFLTMASLLPLCTQVGPGWVGWWRSVACQPECAGKLAPRDGALIFGIADYCKVNPPTMANFRLPIWGHWTQSWEEMRTTSHGWDRRNLTPTAKGPVWARLRLLLWGFLSQQEMLDGLEEN